MHFNDLYFVVVVSLFCIFNKVKGNSIFHHFMLINFKLWYSLSIFFVCEGTSTKRRLKIEGISITILKYEHSGNVEDWLDIYYRDTALLQQREKIVKVQVIFWFLLYIRNGLRWELNPLDIIISTVCLFKDRNGFFKEFLLDKPKIQTFTSN